MSELKLVVLSRYDRQGASSRLRLMQYLPYLKQAGFDVEVASFFDAIYLKEMYAGQRSIGRIASSYAHRLRQMLWTRRADVIWLEKEALPWLPWPIERMFYAHRVPLVSDFDDAVFHSYDLHRSGLVKRVLGGKIDSVMARSDLVFAGNAYLAARARQAGARSVNIIPTVVDTTAYAPHLIKAPDGKPRVGWIGTPETWTKFVTDLVPMLTQTMASHAAIFRAVGAKRPEGEVPEFEFLNWSEDKEIELIQGMDIGIMPLTDTPWSRGKCGYKLIQYMACGLPVIASPVGVNNRIVEHGVNGFLAQTDAEWQEALSVLLQNPDLRQRMGQAGRRKIESEYSIQTYGPKVAALLRQTAKA